MSYDAEMHSMFSISVVALFNTEIWETRTFRIYEMPTSKIAKFEINSRLSQANIQSLAEISEAHNYDNKKVVGWIRPNHSSSLTQRLGPWSTGGLTNSTGFTRNVIDTHQEAGQIQFVSKICRVDELFFYKKKTNCYDQRIKWSLEINDHDEVTVDRPGGFEPPGRPFLNLLLLFQNLKCTAKWRGLCETFDPLSRPIPEPVG